MRTIGPVTSSKQIFENQLRGSTIFFVKLLGLEGELSFQYDIVVKFIPFGQRSYFRTGKSRNWAEIEPIDSKTN
jgi:hypothetical protein